MALNTHFSETVQGWCEGSKAKLDAVYKASVQDTFDFITDFWPVDTGFSRGSFTASLDGWAPISDARPVEGMSYPAPEYSAVINSAPFGAPIYGNFTANYAIYLEHGARGRPGLGVVKRAILWWPQVVAENAAKYRGAKPSASMIFTQGPRAWLQARREARGE